MKRKNLLSSELLNLMKSREERHRIKEEAEDAEALRREEAEDAEALRRDEEINKALLAPKEAEAAASTHDYLIDKNYFGDGPAFEMPGTI